MLLPSIEADGNKITGDTVIGGDIIGITGATGNVTAPASHLHLGMKYNGERINSECILKVI